MSADFGLLARLWDFTDDPDNPLDNALGVAGFDYIVVPVVTAPQRRFRFQPAGDPHAFETEGGWHFPHQPGAYKSGSIKPHAARWRRKRDPLALLTKYAAKRGLRLVMQIDPRGAVPLLEREPHLLARNAWGDPNPALGACVMNPDARELMRNVLGDLAERNPAGFQIVDWMVDAPVETDRIRQYDWRPRLRRLLDICFCPSCRQVAVRAGLDADQTADLVRQAAQRIHVDLDAVAKTSPAEDEAVRRYLAVRRADVHEWLAALANSLTDTPLYMLVDPRTRGDSPDFLEDEIEPLIDAGVIPVFRAPAVGSVKVDVECEILAPITARRDAACGQRLPIWRPHFRQADELVRTVKHAVEAGAACLEFDDLDVAPRGAFDWLRQAVRYARRG